MTKRTLFRCFGIVSLFLPVSLLAQKDIASLEGRVVDAREAVVAQARLPPSMWSNGLPTYQGELFDTTLTQTSTNW